MKWQEFSINLLDVYLSLLYGQIVTEGKETSSSLFRSLLGNIQSDQHWLWSNRHRRPSLV